jgi:hypothetical protein
MTYRGFLPKRRKIYGSDSGQKLKLLARSLDTRIGIRESTNRTNAIAEGFWLPYVECRH